jgi:FKBP-type peptidyl-prolyl cis-trans isomerase 2
MTRGLRNDPERYLATYWSRWPDVWVHGDWASIEEVDDETVTVNFNHPLAGETLSFHVRIEGIRPATPEELEHGHAHGDGHAH